MSPQEVGIFDAKTNLSALVARVKQGQIFYITKRGHRVAEMRPIQQQKCAFVKGCAASPHYRMAHDFQKTPAGFEDYA